MWILNWFKVFLENLCVRIRDVDLPDVAVHEEEAAGRDGRLLELPGPRPHHHRPHLQQQLSSSSLRNEANNLKYIDIQIIDSL